MIYKPYQREVAKRASMCSRVTFCLTTNQEGGGIPLILSREERRTMTTETKMAKKEFTFDQPYDFGLGRLWAQLSRERSAKLRRITGQMHRSSAATKNISTTEVFFVGSNDS